MKISREAATTARRAFRMCVEGDRVVDDKLRKVFKKIADEKPRGWQAILHELKRLTRLEMERRQVLVESAEALEEASQDRIKGSLARKYGDDLSFEFKITPGLLGGIRVRVGNDVWDGSVKTRLDRLSNTF
ncbi:MAG: H(+)-transporting ATPase [Roseibacillus sp.]|jgi:F-type H+-transporting ATPase subunit delta|nr:H(+)-transporting ATPase [Roseibacillus sp.]MBP36050.1 H(+)-transporting ATPase [Roseibacillus sp.]MCP4728627.1 F0F1 ATP synthase subunit delta [Roseibacillus sp.]MDP7308881.1 F0F1 ATP synthase subunit delta [Roseibacillus sp.]MDP7495202.1 F0F1 ATP synthase subunit delta [Roseibacillus sp.]|tara:strand:+ start:469 stop:861 length:393 start_codon:yes stop_codon:yes gene_type:complete